MTSKPSITVSDKDFQRLEAMLDKLDIASPGVRALEEELHRAMVVAQEEMASNIVTMNSQLHCREEKSGKDYHLRLVYPADAGQEGNVSILAPIGTALLGLSVGQKIDWPLPSGQLARLTLLEIQYQPEASQDWHL